MLPLVSEALQSGEQTLESLEADLGLMVKQSQRFPSLYLLKYDLLSPMANPLVQECRGLILDSSRGWEPVCRPFDKFWNVGEPLAAELDWPSVQVQEKLDGSLMSLYYYEGAWRVSSSGHPDAGGPVGDHGITFSDLFWQVFHLLDYRLDNLYPDLTYCLELMTAQNQVVVRHDRPRLVLTGIRSNYSGQEFSPAGEVGDITGFYTVPQFPVLGAGLRERPGTAGAMEALRAPLASMRGYEQEGFILVDKWFKRLKVKCNQYVDLHRNISGMSRRGALALVQSGEDQEILAYFPAWAQVINDYRHQINALVENLEAVWEQHQHLDTAKEFALAVKDLPGSSLLFQRRRGQIRDFWQGIKDMRTESLSELLGGSQS